MTKRKEPKPRLGDLRVWWIPQIPMEPFYVPVKTLEEAQLIVDTLGLYDEFQYKNNIKPDYCNAGGLQMFERSGEGDGQNEWVDWYDENGLEFEEWCEENPRENNSAE